MKVSHRNNEKDGKIVRLLNAGHYFPLYDPMLIKELEESGVVFVHEVFSRILWKKIPPPEEDTLDGYLTALARKYLDMPILGSFTDRGKLMRDLAAEWCVDGAIHFLPWGCRVIGSGAYATADYLQKELNVPSLLIDTDPMDKSIYAKGSVQTRIHAFVEMLREKKRGKE
jgi:benzoyl-CoA reductase/2-hydroxyglutaryl-CoA dehydratase subunit BcrC/BadD/HgdB